MDPAVAWYQEEQEGPAKYQWMKIWETMSELNPPLTVPVENQKPQRAGTEKPNRGGGGGGGIENRLIVAAAGGGVGGGGGDDHHHHHHHHHHHTNALSENNNNNNSNSNNNNNNGGNGNGNNNGNNTPTGGGGGGGTILVNNNGNEKNYNPTRKKAGSTVDNKASTYNMNKQHMRLIGVHGGCPWRPPNYKYGRGIIG